MLSLNILLYSSVFHCILLYSIVFYCISLYSIGYGSTDVHSSQLSLGEIAQVPYLPPRLSVDFDGISPISAQQMYNRDSKMLHETNKLIEAVKQEDAHAIVNALKYGANPCLLINDVSALHLAAGIKSEQRCSTVSAKSLSRFINAVGRPAGSTILNLSSYTSRTFFT